MNPLESALSALVKDLGDLGVRYALVGGLAIGVRTEPRFTRDADVAISATDDRTAQQLIRDLGARGYRPLMVVEQEARGRLATVRLAPRTQGGSGLVLDLLFASSGIELEITKAAETLEVVSGLRMPVAVTGHLIALKILSRDDDERPQDLIDLRSLLKVASQADVKLAREAVELIMKRGFSRGRDLMAEARKLLPD